MRAPSRHLVRLRSLVRSCDFVRSRDGAIAPIFAILLALVLIPAVGAAIDLSRIQSSRTHLQDGADSAALALAHLSPTTPNATLVTTATNWINANVKDPTMTLNSVSVGATGATVTVTAQATVKAELLNSIGVKTMQVQTSSTTHWALSKIEVALVLDNTGSMQEDNKMPTLITAAGNLVKTLYSSNTSGDTSAVKVAVVPFTNTVNVGPSYQNASWITGSLPAAYQTALNAAYPGLDWSMGTDVFSTAGTNRFTLLSKIGDTWGGCVESRPAPYDAQDTAPSTLSPATLFVPYFAPDNSGAVINYYGTNYPAFPNHYMPNYSADSSKSWLVQQSDAAKYNQKQAYTGSYPSVWDIDELGYQLGPNTGCLMQPIQRLTTNQTTVLNEINAMTADGETNLNVGLMWGWHVLSPNAPFADGVPYGTAGVQKIIVFLTDGWNESLEVPDGSLSQYSTQYGNTSLYSGTGYIWQNRTGVGASASQAQRQAALDARTLAVCTNAKAAGVTIYTVRIDVASSQSPAVLQQCASNTASFYDVPQVANLDTAFQAIAGQIGSLRVVQ